MSKGFFSTVELRSLRLCGEFSYRRDVRAAQSEDMGFARVYFGKQHKSALLKGYFTTVELNAISRPDFLRFAELPIQSQVQQEHIHPRLSQNTQVPSFQINS